MNRQPFRPSMLVTSDEAHILVAVSPLWDCGSYATAEQLQQHLDTITLETPGRCDLLNKLRDSFRSRSRAIGFGTATHPMWDTTRGETGPYGFRVAFSLLNKCAERVGLIKFSYGYRKPLEQYGEPM